MALSSRRRFTGKTAVQKLMLRGEILEKIVSIIVACGTVRKVTNAHLPDRALVIPENVAHEIGIPKNHVRVNPKYRGGYPAYIEATHQIHCVVSSLESSSKLFC